MFRYVHLETLNSNRKHCRTRHEELPADLPVEDAWQLALNEPLFKVLLDDPDAVLDQCDAALRKNPTNSYIGPPGLQASVYFISAARR
jgi:hypothetical protein